MKTPPSSSPSSASDAAPGRRSVLDWARQEGEAEPLIAALDAHLRRRTALGLTAALILTGLVWQPWRDPTLPVSAGNALVLRAATRTLPDGTIVELNAGAEIAVDFSGPFRRVALLRGEGHFQVAKNPQRPFIVSAAGIEVRAVGTAFSVDRSSGKVDVLVTEGRVAVEQPAAPGPSALTAPPSPPSTLGTLGAGRRLVVTVPTESGAPATATSDVAVSPLELQQRLAWRVPRLEFSATPLSEAIALFNAQATKAGREPCLALADPALGRLQLSGILRADDLESLLRLLDGEFQLKAEPRGNVLLLQRR